MKVPVGHNLSGKPFRFYPWQRDFLRNATRRYNILSTGRKNGKTATVAGLCLGWLAGPLNQPGHRVVAVSLTTRHVQELQTAIHQTALASGIEDQLSFRKTPVPGIIHGLNDSKVEFLAADKCSGHSVGADVVLVDELGLMDETNRAMWNALCSSVSAKNGRIIAISVQGHGPMMEELWKKRDDPAIYFKRYMFDELTYAYDDPKGWKDANPGLSTIKSLSYMRDAARLMLHGPERNAFLSFDLNMNVDPKREMICLPRHFNECVVEESELPDREGELFVGLDAGGSSSMTAAAAYWPLSGRLEVWGAFPKSPSLKTRGEKDGVGNLYERMKDDGILDLHEGRITSLDRFLADAATRLAGYRVARLASDRFRKEETYNGMRLAGLDWPIEWRDLGFVDGAGDVRAFQREVATHSIKIVRNLMLESAVAESSLKFDPAGNGKLDRSRSNSRIDALQAACLAIGMGHRWRAGVEAMRLALAENEKCAPGTPTPADIKTAIQDRLWK